jgi:carbon-monoxide dehydrogenase medium subunit
MTRFTYHRPTTLDEALALFAEYGEAARVLAGGTDLVPKLRDGRLAPLHLVSLRQVEELHRITFDPGDGLRIGAGARIRDVGAHSAVLALYPALAHACAVMATPQIRNMGTVAGNLANGSPCADTAGPLLVYDAQVTLAAQTGRREIPLAQLYRGPGELAVGPSEVITAISVPAPPADSGSAYVRLSARSRVDMAAVSVAGLLVVGADGRIATARLALGAVAPTPTRCPEAEAILAGAKPAPGRLDEAAEAAAAAARPIDDVRASAAYRRAMVGVLTRRVLASCVRRARGGGR